MFAFKKFILPCVSLFILVACSKSPQNTPDPNPPIEPPPIKPPVEQPSNQKCTLLKGVYYQNNVAYDSSEFVYSDTSIIRTNEASGRYYTFEYSNGTIVKRNHFLKGANQAAAYTNFSYNAENNITAIEIYDGNNKVRSFYFNYNAGKLEKLVAKKFSSITSSEVVEYETSYTYTGENITQSTKVQNIGGNTQTEVINYSYDNLDNFLKKRTNAFLVEPYFFSLEGSLYPYFFSKNNIKGIVYNGGANSPHTYRTNTSGYLTEITINNQIASRYRYECK